MSRVGSFIRSRTRDTTGAITGTFSDTTSPTAGQVAVLMDQAYAMLVAAVGTVPADLGEVASPVLALGTAYFIDRDGPADSDSIANDSPSSDLYRAYRDAVKDLQSAMGRAGEAPVGSAAALVPAYYTDPAAYTNMGTRF